MLEEAALVGSVVSEGVGGPAPARQFAEAKARSQPRNLFGTDDASEAESRGARQFWLRRLSLVGFGNGTEMLLSRRRLPLLLASSASLSSRESVERRRLPRPSERSIAMMLQMRYSRVE